MRNNSRSLEMETWHDLANVYTNLSQWRDAEVCLIKSEAINPHSASRCHSTGITCLIHLSWLMFLTFLVRCILECTRCRVEVKPIFFFCTKRYLSIPTNRYNEKLCYRGYLVNALAEKFCKVEPIEEKFDILQLNFILRFRL